MATQGSGGASASGFYEAPKGEGWVVFAAAMLGLVGLFNLIEGTLAIADSRVYVADSTFVFSNLNTWGWIVLILGVAMLLAAFSVATGSEWARWFGIGAAGLNAIGQLMFLPAYPLWSISMFAVDIVIIYALAVYGGSRLKI